MEEDEDGPTCRLTESYRRPYSTIAAKATYTNFRQCKTSGRLLTEQQR
jgi:hypothetical protein